jgi:7-carboxy-7-deazaguanine synthase
MQVMEIYRAPQGEGIFIGEPSVFIRFFGCNLRCSWCDTAYSINTKEWSKAFPEAEEGPYIEMSPNEIAEAVLTYGGITQVVLTGGEPLLQMDFGKLTDKLISFGSRVTVETNGTVIPNEWPTFLRLSEAREQILWSISPKMSSAATVKPDKEKLEMFLTRGEPVQLKFVISTIADFDEAIHLLNTLSIYTCEPHIVFQPNGMVLDQEFGLAAYIGRLKWMQALLLQKVQYKNARVLPQLHAMIHGWEARGV